MIPAAENIIRQHLRPSPGGYHLAHLLTFPPMYSDDALIYNFLLFCDHESSCNHVKNQCSQTPMGLKTNCLLPCGVDRQKPGKSRLQILCSVMNRPILRSYWRSCQLLSQKVRNISKQSSVTCLSHAHISSLPIFFNSKTYF